MAADQSYTPGANAALLDEASYMFGVHVVRSPLPPRPPRAPAWNARALLTRCLLRARTQLPSACMRGCKLDRLLPMHASASFWPWQLMQVSARFLARLAA